MRYQWKPNKEAPEKTKFMGRVWFRKTAGNVKVYVDVTDPEVLKKLKNHPEFRLKPEPKTPKKRTPKKAIKKSNGDT